MVENLKISPENIEVLKNSDVKNNKKLSQKNQENILNLLKETEDLDEEPSDK